MSVIDIRRRTAEKLARKTKLPPRAPAPDAAKEALAKVQADIAARKKAKGDL